MTRGASGRPRGADRGSVLLAMLGIVALTGVATIGFATIVNGQVQTRHDTAFAQALNGAESGLSSLVAQIRADPSASSYPAVAGSDPTSGVSYSGTATKQSSDGSGVTWLIDSTGTARVGQQTVVRRVQEEVTSKSVYSVPLFGDTALTMGAGSGVDAYDSTATPSSCQTLPDTGILGLLATTMCTSATTVQGAAATNGDLTMSGADLTGFEQVDIDNAAPAGYDDPAATGNCLGDATACASSTVVRAPTALTFPDSTGCSEGIGVDASAIAGSSYLAAGAVYDVTGNLTLNAAVTANLTNLSSSAVTLCFGGDLLIPSLGAAGVTLPWNSYISSVLPLQYTPRPPATLRLIDTAAAGDDTTITIGDGLNPETALSAVIYAPHARCVVKGHLDLYGTLVCGSVSAPDGISVHYDTELSTTPAEQTVTVANWREVSPA